MNIPDLLRRSLFALAPYVLPRKFYVEDALVTTHNHDFVFEKNFEHAYDCGMENAGRDLRMRWRVHVALWVARQSARLAGNFVECGVSHGVVSAAIMYNLQWGRRHRHRTFYLLDRFDGFKDKSFYADNVKVVRQHFERLAPNFQIVQGNIPETLSVIQGRIAYLHLDLNVPELEARTLQLLYPQLTPGAFVLFDDFAYAGSNARAVIHGILDRAHFDIMSLPTGQGLLIKR